MLGSAPDKVLDTKLVHIEDSDTRLGLIKDHKFAIVKFSADWCGPCKRIAPIYEEMANKDTDDCVYMSEDIELDCGEYAEEISALPAFHFFRDGVFIGKLLGCDVDVLVKKIEDLKSI